MIILVAIIKLVQPERATSSILATYTQIIIALSPLLFWRHDIFLALLSVAGLYAILAKCPALAGVMIGFSIAKKFYAMGL